MIDRKWIKYFTVQCEDLVKETEQLHDIANYYNTTPLELVQCLFPIIKITTQLLQDHGVWQDDKKEIHIPDKDNLIQRYNLEGKWIGTIRKDMK